MSTDRLREFFNPMVRRSFAELGIGEAQVVEYVSELLSGFARCDRLYRLEAGGKSIDSVVQMLAELLDAPPTGDRIEWEREVRRYIGDYTLFMSGMFRSHVSRGGYLDYYLEEGSRSYRTVSKLDLSRYRTGFLMFEELSKRFEFYSGALDYLRQSYFAPGSGEDPFADFLKEMRGWEKLSRN